MRYYTDLTDLPELGMLELDNNCITDVSGLTSLKDLYSLGLNGNPVENIELLDFIPDFDY